MNKRVIIGKFKAVSSLAHIGLISLIVLGFLMPNIVIYAAYGGERLSDAAIGNLSTIIVQVFTSLTTIVGGLIGYFIRKDQEHIEPGNIGVSSNLYPDLDTLGNSQKIGGNNV